MVGRERRLRGALGGFWMTSAWIVRRPVPCMPVGDHVDRVARGVFRRIGERRVVAHDSRAGGFVLNFTVSDTVAARRRAMVSSCPRAGSSQRPRAVPCRRHAARRAREDLCDARGFVVYVSRRCSGCATLASLTPASATLSACDPRVVADRAPVHVRARRRHHAEHRERLSSTASRAMASATPRPGSQGESFTVRSPIE